MAAQRNREERRRREVKRNKWEIVEKRRERRMTKVRRTKKTGHRDRERAVESYNCAACGASEGIKKIIMSTVMHFQKLQTTHMRIGVLIAPHWFKM